MNKVFIYTDSKTGKETIYAETNKRHPKLGRKWQELRWGNRRGEGLKPFGRGTYMIPAEQIAEYGDKFEYSSELTRRYND